MNKQIEKPQDFFDIKAGQTISIFRSKITHFIQDENWLQLFFDNGTALGFHYKEYDNFEIGNGIDGWLYEGEVFNDDIIEIYDCRYRSVGYFHMD